MVITPELKINIFEFRSTAFKSRALVRNRQTLLVAPYKQKSWVSSPEVAPAPEFTGPPLSYDLNTDEMENFKHVSPSNSKSLRRSQLGDLE